MAEAKPYIVKWCDQDDNVHETCVVAYDLMEAVQTVSLQAVGRGTQAKHVIDIAPDTEALAASKADEETRRGLEMARALGKAREQ